MLVSDDEVESCYQQTACLLKSLSSQMMMDVNVLVAPFLPPFVVAAEFVRPPPLNFAPFLITFLADHDHEST